jgi:hypothetical protein
MSLAVRLRPNAVCQAPRLAFKVTILKFGEASRLKIRLTSGREDAKSVLDPQRPARAQ